jgi:hypothetical protein
MMVGDMNFGGILDWANSTTIGEAVSTSVML